MASNLIVKASNLKDPKAMASNLLAASNLS